jgi:hypothetical protein
MDGLAMYNAIRERRADCVAVIDGYAVSIASVIPLAAGKVVSPRSAIWMIHNAWTFAQGDADVMRQQAYMLEEHDEMLAEIYAAKTGKDLPEIRRAMKSETWYRGTEAVTFGLADEGDSDECETPIGLTPSRVFASRYKNLASLRGGASNAPARSSTNNSQHIMDKTKLIAQLRAMGVTIGDDASEEQILAALSTAFNKQKVAPPAPPVAVVPQAPPVAAAPQVDLTGQIQQLSAALQAIRRREVEGAIDGLIAEGRVTKPERTFLVSAALNDETVLGTLRQRQPALAAPVVSGTVVTLGAESPLEPIFKLPKGERFSRLTRDWNELIQDALVRDARGENRIVNPYAARMGGASPVAANTYSSTLVTAFLIEGAVTPLQNRLAALKAFTRDFSTDRYKPRSTGQVKKVTGGSTTQTNATNFESGNSVVTNAPIAVNQYTQPFHVSNDDLNSGLRMEDLVRVNMAAFANKLIQVATADITEANFANYNGGSYITPPGAFGWSDMALLWGALKKADERHAMLDGEFIAQLLNVPTMFQTGVRNGSDDIVRNYGWDGLHLNTEWSGAGAGCRGFACHRQALGAVAGLPLTPPQVGQQIPGGILNESTAEVPEVGLSFAVYLWFSTASRAMWCSFDAMFGAAKLDTTAGIFLKAN